MALRVQNENPYLIGGNTGSAYVPVSYGDFVEIDSSKIAVPSTTTPTFTYSEGMNNNGVVVSNNGNSSQVGSNPSTSYAQGTNNYGAGTGNYITPSQTVDTTYTQALGAVIPTSTPTNDYTPYNGGGGTIVLDTKTGGTKVVDNGTGSTGLPDGVKLVQVPSTTGRPPEDIDPNKVTPDQYYKYMYETGLSNAEKAKQQAIINAKGQYNEFINPYGVQAEQQARMGLAGGGYSEYLKGKAYEGMIDTQNQARSDYAKTQQSLYSDYMGNMAAYNQTKQDKADAGKVAKADLLNKISKYTSQEALGAALDALGITDATERQTYIDAWTKWKTENDAKVQADNKLTMQAVIDGNSEYEPSLDNIQSVGERLGLSQEEIDSWKQKFERKQYAESPSAEWTADDWQSFFNKGLDENGEGEAWFDSLSEDEQEAAKEEYSATIAKAMGYNDKTGATTYFFDGDDGKPLNESEAKSRYEEATADDHFTQPLKDAIKKEYEERYRNGRTIEDSDIVKKAQGIQIPKGANVTIADDAKVVDISKDTFQHSDFGKFNDTAKPGSGQYELIEAIISAARAGDIPNGKIVLVNYGRNNGGFKSVEAFMYVDGKFVQIEKGESVRIPKEMLYELDGYEYTGAGRTDDPTIFYDSIRKKKN